MEDGFRLQDAKVAIIGLGLMGGSLALALKGKCAALYGIDTHPATLQLALDKQIVDQADADSIRLLPQADLIILATPVLTIIDFIQNLSVLTQNRCIVLDLGSTKQDILQVMTDLPENFDPIGGHPICGKEKLGLENADGNLYAGALFVITALERTSARAKSVILEIISTIGAHAVEMNAEEHDQALAFTSHLPFLLASALAFSIPVEYYPFTGTGFRSTSRVAGTSSSIMLGILQSNRENVLKALSFFQQQLSEIQTKLTESDFQNLEGLLNHSRISYQSLALAPDASAGVSNH